MEHAHIGFGWWLYDWQSLIAGVLALIAGGVAYCAGWQQVNAVRSQTAAIRQQNSELKRGYTRKLAREGIVAFRLIEGGLGVIEDGITRLEKTLDQPTYFASGATVPLSYRSLIKRPALDTVWNHLGLCNFEVINNYILLDAKLQSFSESEVFGVDSIKNDLAAFRNILRHLHNELERDSARCNLTLKQTEETI